MIRYGMDIDALTSRLIDDFSRAALQGALRVADDNQNPIRGNLFALAVREVLTYMLHKLAPDSDVKNCSWFISQTDDGRPTREQRQRYVIQGGLSDCYVTNTLRLDVGDLHRRLADSVKTLHKATHFRPGTMVGYAADVDTLAKDAFGSLAALLNAIDHCRQEMMKAVTEAVVDETTDEVFRDTIQTIDESATHHRIEEIDVHDINTVKIDAHHVWYRVTGTIGTRLQWGSNSDLRRGDGATFPRSFPFVCDIPAPVEKPESFDSSKIKFVVTGGDLAD